MKIFVYSFREFDEKKIFDDLSKKYGFEYDCSAEYPTLENAYLAKGYDTITFTPCLFGKDMIDKYKSVGVKYIAARSIGFDHIDLAYAKEAGMGVSHVTYDPDTVADYAVMLMLMGCRKAMYIYNRSLLQDFSLKGKLGKDLGELTVGVIGTGNIGATVIKRLNAFGCKVLAYDVYQKSGLECKYVSLDELLKNSDLITLHAPVTEQTTHILNEDAFSKMKDGVMIINTARGLLVDTDALIANLKSGKVDFAGLDVLEYEDGLYYHNRMGDVIDNDRMAILRSFPNVLLMPHTAFYTEKVSRTMAENVVKCVFDMENKKDSPLINVMP